MDTVDRLVEDRLAALREPAAGARMHLDPAVLRARAGARRRRRRGAVLGSAVLVVASVLVPIELLGGAATTGLAQEVQAHPVTAPAGGGHVALSQVTTAGSGDVAGAEQGFSLALLRELDRSDSSPNPLISPSSLAIALSMLELGARGDTRTQISQALGTGGFTPEQQATDWAALDASLAGAAKGGVTFNSANGLWMQQGFPLEPSFLSQLARLFSSGVWQVDFAHHPAQSVAALNQWVARQTHGHITQLFSAALDPDTVLVLANAEYLDARWERPFTTTSSGPFDLATGRTVTVHLMGEPETQPLSVPVTTGPGVDAAQLPYVGGRLAALVIMPRSGSLPGFVASLTTARLQQIVSSLEPTSVDLTLPELSLQSDNHMVPVLQGLGMNDAFDPDRADLSGISRRPLVVTAVEQHDTLDVNPIGSVASAATGMGISTAAVEVAPMSITFNHPFLFLVRDTQSGAILFEAQVNDPSES